MSVFPEMLHLEGSDLNESVDFKINSSYDDILGVSERQGMGPAQRK